MRREKINLLSGFMLHKWQCSSDGTKNEIGILAHGKMGGCKSAPSIPHLPPKAAGAENQT